MGTVHRNRNRNGNGNRNGNVDRSLTARLLAVLLAAGLTQAAGPAAASLAEHSEFDASLAAPYRGDASGARSFTLVFEYPLVAAPQTVAWHLELIAPDDRVVRQWDGAEALVRGPVSVDVRWDGRFSAAPAPAGIYQVRMQAWSRDAGTAAATATVTATGVSDAAAPDDVVLQQWDIAVGRLVAPAMPAFRALPSAGADVNATPGADVNAAPAPASLPYTVYLGNLHSQSSHSDDWLCRLPR